MAAARAERNGTRLESEFRGVAFTLPPSLPASILFDIEEIKANQGAQFEELREMIVGLIGVDAWRAVRRKMREDADSMDKAGDLFVELLGAITTPYGVTAGEPSASAAT